MIAVLYDVHGNLPALEAVLGECSRLEVDGYVLGGDYALFGPWPAETLARLRELPRVRWIRGNVDRWTAEGEGHEPSLQEAVSACRGAIGEEAARFLGGLPQWIADGDTLFCHASPRSDMESFLPEPADDEDGLLAGTTARRLVFGHTHLQFTRVRRDGLMLVNPGSVGMPLDGDPRAAWALIDPSGEIEPRRVAYDHEASARAVLERFGEVEWSQRSARRLRTATP